MGLEALMGTEATRHTEQARSLSDRYLIGSKEHSTATPINDQNPQQLQMQFMKRRMREISAARLRLQARGSQKQPAREVHSQKVDPAQSLLTVPQGAKQVPKQVPKANQPESAVALEEPSAHTQGRGRGHSISCVHRRQPLFVDTRKDTLDTPVQAGPDSALRLELSHFELQLSPSQSRAARHLEETIHNIFD